MTINLRGVKELGMTFAIPTYFFLLMAFTLPWELGCTCWLTGTLPVVTDAPQLVNNVFVPLSWLVILRAFTNGTTSLTGVEAISNGITAFN